MVKFSEEMFRLWLLIFRRLPESWLCLLSGAPSQVTIFNYVATVEWLRVSGAQSVSPPPEQSANKQTVMKSGIPIP